ncbi:MAG: DUF5946 family protein [Acidimicrobiia bacterium]
MSSKRQDPACEWCGVAGCAEIFDRCLACEFSDPEFFAVHHLSVPAYGLQHGHYESEAAAAVATMMLEHIATMPSAGATASLRDRFGGRVRVRRRGGSATRLSDLPSIAAVDFSSAASYRATVRTWAGAVARSVLS